MLASPLALALALQIVPAGVLSAKTLCFRVSDDHTVNQEWEKRVNWRKQWAAHLGSERCLKIGHGPQIAGLTREAIVATRE